MPRGSCLCGDIAYEIAGPFLEAHHCHCSMCRKEHGTPYATYGIAPASGMQWLRGRAQIARFESSEGFYRAFCPRCGSLLPGAEFQGLVFIPLGNLDGDPAVKPLEFVVPIVDRVREMRRGHLRHPAADGTVIQDHHRLVGERQQVGRREPRDPRSDHAHVDVDVLGERRAQWRLGRRCP